MDAPLEQDFKDLIPSKSGFEEYEKDDKPASDDGLFSHDKYKRLISALEGATLTSVIAWFTYNDFSEEKIAEVLGSIQAELDAKAAKAQAMVDVWTTKFRGKWKAAWLAKATEDSKNFYEFSPETWAEVAGEFGGIDPAIAKEKIAEVPFLFPKVMTQDEFDGAVGVVKSWGAKDEVALNFMRALVRMWNNLVTDVAMASYIDGAPETPFTPLIAGIDAAYGDEFGLDAYTMIANAETPDDEGGED
jgi:hypothetical protein